MKESGEETGACDNRVIAPLLMRILDVVNVTEAAVVGRFIDPKCMSTDFEMDKVDAILTEAVEFS